MPWRRSALTAALCAALLFASVTPAAAAPDGSPAGGAAPDHRRPDTGGGSGSASGGGGGGLSVGDDDDPQSIGTVNPLDVRNPFCDERLDRAERRNCEVTGTPEGRYPTSNYSIDIHIDTGLDNIIGNFQALLAQIANAVWQACLFVLNLVLTLLGWAFGLTPFSDRETMGSIDRGLGRFYSAFTEPWLIFAMVAVGVFGLYGGLVRREASASIAGTLASVALMIGALWILNEPGDTVGVVSDFTNDASLAVLAAPQGGVSDPEATYAEATAQVWNDMTIPGFAVLNFSDLEWALSKPDPELLETANEKVCVDAAYLAQIPPKKWEQLIAAGEDPDCGDVLAFVPAPRTNAEIYLRSSPGSPSREALWEEHTDDAPYASYFAIQGKGGAWTRLPLVVLIALGLLGGICLLAWLALRIFVQTAVAFVLVLMTPLAFFLPAFGEKGRATFALWGGTLAGALVSKLVYSALLSVVLFATTVIASLADDFGTGVAFLVMAGIWWAVFLKRESLISFMSVSDGEPGDGRLGGGMFGLYAASQLGQTMLSPLTRRMGGSGREIAGLRGDRAEATRRVAAEQLDGRAERRLDGRLVAERGIVSEQSERRSKLAALGGQHTDALKEARRREQAAAVLPAGPERERQEAQRRAALARAEELEREQGALREQIGAAEPREQQARAFIGAATERAAQSGKRWTPGDVAGARELIRSEVDRPLSDPGHAWRVGMSAERYAALSGPERERVHGQITQQLRDDRAAFGAIPDRPQGLVGRRVAGVRYRARAHRREGGAGALARARGQARRSRRSRRLAHRRGVSR